MLNIAYRHTAMSGTAVENPPQSREEILEDGEIEDGDESENEIIETENILVDEPGSQSAEDVPTNDLALQQQDDGSFDTKSISRQNHETHDMEDDCYVSPMDTEEKRKYKKHQRKRKRHKESKEKEQEKKERRRKRKMHGAAEDADVDHEHGGSASPHGKKRKKRKKHSKEHKGSTSPDSFGSEEEVRLHSHRQRQLKDSEAADFDDDYDGDTYPTTKSQSGGNSSINDPDPYYSSTYQDEGTYDSNSESGSDFEAQLAEYKNYKTKNIHGEEGSDSHYDETNYSRYPESKSVYSRKRGQSFNGRQRCPRSKRSRWEQSSKIDGESSKRVRRADDVVYQYGDYDDSFSEGRLCKFFAEGNCLKGDDCTFIHNIEGHKNGCRSHRYLNQSRSRRRELCKYYLAGHCHHGDSCAYMHSEYPCKYFHTGVTCFSGKNCRFSHDPPTDETREIVENLKDVYNSVDDSWEISELAKLGVKAHLKPPPGVGLLPTPNVIPGFMSSHPNIPSLFDIHVEPTPDFQRRIDENSVASLSMTDESEGPSEVVPDTHTTSKQLQTNPDNTAPRITTSRALLPTPIRTLPISATRCQEDGGGNGFYDNFYQADHNMDGNVVQVNEKHRKTEPDGGNESSTDDFIRIGGTTVTEDEPREASVDVKAPDFLPATQKALFIRIHQKRTSLESDKQSGMGNSKGNAPDSWTYSSDDEEKIMTEDGEDGIIKIDADIPESNGATVSSASVESILKMIAGKKGDLSTNVDTNLLSKVASVINMPAVAATTSDHYNPASSTVTYNPAQLKTSLRRPSAGGQNTRHNHQQRERQISDSSNASPGHPSTKHHHHPIHSNPIRRRLSTQELSKEPLIIPLVAKQGTGTVNSTHPDPRLTLSRLLQVKLQRYSATLPRFSKDLILPGSGKMIGLKITLSSDNSKVAKRDPRLGRRKDPRMQKSNDPRLKNRSAAKTSNVVPTLDNAAHPSAPPKPSALLTKSATVIPSLPELDLDLAHVNTLSKEVGDPVLMKSHPSSKLGSSYALPQQIKLPKLMKAPISSPTHKDRISSEESPSAKPTIAPYDPRYMASGPVKSAGSDICMNTAPYDPRVLSSQPVTPACELKKRTIQLPKLTPAPTYKLLGDCNSEVGLLGVNEKPEGDQGDF